MDTALNIGTHVSFPGLASPPSLRINVGCPLTLFTWTSAYAWMQLRFTSYVRRSVATVRPTPCAPNYLSSFFLVHRYFALCSMIFTIHYFLGLT
jgi:hypothetical protein